MKKNILILDDEINASDYLKETIEEYISTDNFFNEYTVDTANNFNTFMEKLEVLEPAIIFLILKCQTKMELKLLK